MHSRATGTTKPFFTTFPSFRTAKHKVVEFIFGPYLAFNFSLSRRTSEFYSTDRIKPYATIQNYIQLFLTPTRHISVIEMNTESHQHVSTLPHVCHPLVIDSL